MDNETYSTDELTRAYGMAAHAGDTDAMTELHGRLLNSYKAQDAVQNNPTTGMSAGSRFIAGVGQGMKRLGEGVGNLIGAVPDQKLRDEDDIAKPLMNTGAGKVGSIAGQVAATAPLGMGTGALARAAAPTLASTGAYLPAVFRAALAAGEGAGQGAAMASPDEQGAGAMTGAALGGTLSAAGSAVGRAIRGLVGKSVPAQRLMQDADEEGKDLFIPISQGGTGAAKPIYQKVLPYALGVEHQLGKQSEQAKDVVSEIAAEHGMPAQTNATGSLQKVHPQFGDTMGDTAANMKQQYQDAYNNTVKSYAFNAPQDFAARVRAAVGSELPKGHSNAIANHMDNVLGEFADDQGTITGENLLKAKIAAEQTLPKLTSSTGVKIADPTTTKKAVSTFDGIIQDAIDEHKQMSLPKSKVDVEHEVGGVGDHTLKTPNGEATLQESGPYLQMNRIDVKPSAQGTGEGMAMMERAAHEAGTRGLTLASDVSVSPSAQNLYKALGNRGYQVTENAAEPGVGGSLVSKDPRVPVFQVTPKAMSKTQQAASETARDLENFQRLGPAEAEGSAVTSTSEANPAGRGALKFKTLAENAPENSGMRSLAQDAHEVLEKESPGGVNPAGRHFLHGGALATAAIHPSLAPSFLTGNLLGNALATKTVQKGLYGDLASQKAIAAYLRNNPQKAYSAGMAGRSAVNASGQ